MNKDEPVSISFPDLFENNFRNWLKLFLATALGALIAVFYTNSRTTFYETVVGFEYEGGPEGHLKGADDVKRGLSEVFSTFEYTKHFCQVFNSELKKRNVEISAVIAENISQSISSQQKVNFSPDEKCIKYFMRNHKKFLTNRKFIPRRAFHLFIDPVGSNSWKFTIMVDKKDAYSAILASMNRALASSIELYNSGIIQSFGESRTNSLAELNGIISDTKNSYETISMSLKEQLNQLFQKLEKEGIRINNSTENESRVSNSSFLSQQSMSGVPSWLCHRTIKFVEENSHFVDSALSSIIEALKKARDSQKASRLRKLKGDILKLSSELRSSEDTICAIDLAYASHVTRNLGPLSGEKTLLPSITPYEETNVLLVGEIFDRRDFHPFRAWVAGGFLGLICGLALLFKQANNVTFGQILRLFSFKGRSEN